MKDPQSLLERFLLSVEQLPDSNLIIHSGLLNDLSESKFYQKCLKIQTKKCILLDKKCLDLMDQIFKSNHSSCMFLFYSVFHVIKHIAVLDDIFDYFVNAIIKSNSKLSSAQLDIFNEFLKLFVTNDERFDLILQKAEKQFLRSPEVILKGINVTFIFSN